MELRKRGIAVEAVTYSLLGNAKVDEWMRSARRSKSVV